MANELISSRAIIFSDLDGTLLDHDSYQFDAASNALAAIKRLSIPLILNSSKTFAEIITIQQKLDICQPLICENGAAVYLPDTNTHPANWQCHAFSKKREIVLQHLQQLRQQYGYRFIGFSDCDGQGISDLTGLPLAQAQQAASREFSEPVLWQDSEEALTAFIQKLHEYQLTAQQGGRFLSIMGQANKAAAMQWLCNYYSGEKPVSIVALGDSPNDAAMLNAADIAVVIKSARSHLIQLEKPNKVIRTQQPGPIGWQAAMDEILPTLSSAKGEL